MSLASQLDQIYLFVLSCENLDLLRVGLLLLGSLEVRKHKHTR